MANPKTLFILFMSLAGFVALRQIKSEAVPPVANPGMPKPPTKEVTPEVTPPVAEPGMPEWRYIPTVKYTELTEGMTLIDQAGDRWFIKAIDKTGVPARWAYTLENPITGLEWRRSFTEVERYLKIEKSEAPVTPEVTKPQGKLVTRSYRTPVGIVVDYGIQIGDTVYEPRASAISPLGVSEAKKGWSEISEETRQNYRGWEGKKGAFGNRARKIADIEKRWDEIIAKGKISQEHAKEQLASYESYQKRRAEAERQFSLKSSDLVVGLTLENVATGNREVITEITPDGIVFARPEDAPTQSGGLIGRGEVKGYRLAIQKSSIS